LTFFSRLPLTPKILYAYSVSSISMSYPLVTYPKSSACLAYQLVHLIQIQMFH
jgi:hypothetical protein